MGEAEQQVVRSRVVTGDMAEELRMPDAKRPRRQPRASGHARAGRQGPQGRQWTEVLCPGLALPPPTPALQNGDGGGSSDGATVPAVQEQASVRPVSQVSAD